MIPQEALSNRKYQFTGPDSEYIRHLETRVEELERSLQAQSRSPSNDQSDLVVHIEDPTSHQIESLFNLTNSTHGTECHRANLKHCPVDVALNAEMLFRPWQATNFVATAGCQARPRLSTSRRRPFLGDDYRRHLGKASPCAGFKKFYCHQDDTKYGVFQHKIGHASFALVPFQSSLC